MPIGFGTVQTRSSSTSTLRLCPKAVKPRKIATIATSSGDGQSPARRQQPAVRERQEQVEDREDQQDPRPAQGPHHQPQQRRDLLRRRHRPEPVRRQRARRQREPRDHQQPADDVPRLRATRSARRTRRRRPGTATSDSARTPDRGRTAPSSRRRTRPGRPMSGDADGGEHPDRAGQRPGRRDVDARHRRDPAARRRRSRLDARSTVARERAGSDVEIDLVAQPRRRRRRRALGVDRRPVEPPVDDVLDAPPQRLEQREGDERRAATAMVWLWVNGREQGLDPDDRRRRTWRPRTPVTIA